MKDVFSVVVNNFECMYKASLFFLVSTPRFKQLLKVLAEMDQFFK